VWSRPRGPGPLLCPGPRATVAQNPKPEDVSGEVALWQPDNGAPSALPLGRCHALAPAEVRLGWACPRGGAVVCDATGRGQAFTVHYRALV
jgi:hypothetical protein